MLDLTWVVAGSLHFALCEFDVFTFGSTKEYRSWHSNSFETIGRVRRKKAEINSSGFIDSLNKYRIKLDKITT